MRARIAAVAPLLALAALLWPEAASPAEPPPEPVAAHTAPAPVPATAPVPDHCSDYDAMERGEGHPENQHWFNHLDARGYARLRLACVYGGGAQQWECLDHLWGPLESGWNHRADNPTSSAYGVPQALPGSKMGPGWRDDPRVQVRWGLGYVEDRYGTACAARSHRLRRGWY